MEAPKFYDAPPDIEIRGGMVYLGRPGGGTVMPIAAFQLFLERGRRAVAKFHSARVVEIKRAEH